MPALSQTRAYGALLLIAILWGTFPATGKLAVADFPPVFLTALRGVIASSFLVVLLVRSGAESMRALDATAVRAFVTLGVCGLVLSTQLSYIGYAYTTAANAAILQAATPVLVALGARAYLGERLRRRQQAGVALSALGVLVVVTDGRLFLLRVDQLRVGDFITMVGLVAWTAYTLYGKRVVTIHSPALTTTAAYVAGTGVLVRRGRAHGAAVPAAGARLGAGVERRRLPRALRRRGAHLVVPRRRARGRQPGRRLHERDAGRGHRAGRRCCWPSPSASGRCWARCWCWAASR